MLTRMNTELQYIHDTSIQIVKFLCTRLMKKCNIISMPGFKLLLRGQYVLSKITDLPRR